MVKCSKMACVGDNLITQTMHKTTQVHYRTHDQIVQDLCPSLYIMQQKLGRSLGTRLANTYVTFISLKYSYNHTSV